MTGLITGVAWGIIKKTGWAKYVFVSLLLIALISVVVFPTPQYNNVEIVEFFIQLGGFLIGSGAGSLMYDEYFS